MLDSRDRIPTSHAGSLPRAPVFLAANDARELNDDGLNLRRLTSFPDGREWIERSASLVGRERARLWGRAA